MMYISSEAQGDTIETAALQSTIITASISLADFKAILRDERFAQSTQQVCIQQVAMILASLKDEQIADLVKDIPAVCCNIGNSAQAEWQRRRKESISEINQSVI